VTTGDLRKSGRLRTYFRGSFTRRILVPRLGDHPHPRRIKDFYSINVDGVRNLLQAAETACPLGSGHRVGWRLLESPVGCKVRTRIICLMNLSVPPVHELRSARRLMMELAVKEVEARGKLGTVIVRPPWFYGPDQPRDRRSSSP